MMAPAMLSVITVVSMPSLTSSQAVSRAPCRNGPGLVGEDGHALARLDRTTNHAERGAVAGGRQGAGIAVGEDARFVRHDARRRGGR